MSNIVKIKLADNCFRTSTRFNKRHAALDFLDQNNEIPETTPNSSLIPITAHADNKYLSILHNTISDQDLDAFLSANDIKDIPDATPEDFIIIDIPKRASTGAAGFDLQAAIDDTLTIKPGAVAMVSTGLSFSLPENLELQIRPRSGLAAKNSVTVVNSPGTLDSDFRGVCQVLLINHGTNDFIINRGDRIAQGVFNKVEIPEFVEVNSLDETVRGSGGFGSTGVKTDK